MGLECTTLLDADVVAEVASGASLGSAQASLAGKDLIRLDNPDSNPVGDLWLYAVGDTIFGVQSTSESIIEEILGLWPVPGGPADASLRLEPDVRRGRYALRKRRRHLAVELGGRRQTDAPRYHLAGGLETTRWLHALQVEAHLQPAT